MSFWTSLVGNVRHLVLLDDKVARLQTKLDSLDTQVGGHERRVQQIETVLFGPVPPDQLRIR